MRAEIKGDEKLLIDLKGIKEPDTQYLCIRQTGYVISMTVHVASHTLRKRGKSILVCGDPGFCGMVGLWTRLSY